MTLEKMLRYVVLAGIFALPFIVLYVSRSLFFPFITGKNFAFRIIVEIIAGGWLTLALVNPAYRPKRTWLLWAFGIFVILIGISDIFGTYPLKSFWSNYERMEGWVTLAHLFVYFVVATSVLATEKLWHQWWRTSLGVSVIVAFYALFQLLGFITINQGGVRLDATFGNATYLGVYMLFHVFIACLLLARSWVENAPGKRAPLVVIYGGAIALNTLILFFTATRGAILGLIGGAVLAMLLILVASPSSSLRRPIAITLASLAVIAGLFFLVRDTAFVRGIEPLARLASISASETTITSRFMNIGMAWEGFKERPIFGWGQENYAAVFDKHYNPEMYAQEPWFDRTHNIIFDWLIAGGILGLLAYLSLHAVALYLLWRSDTFALYERAILTGLLAGYFFYLLFTFDNITSYLFFVSLLGYITVRATQSEAPLFAQKSFAATYTPALLIGVVILVFGAGWYVNADAIAQNRSIIRGISTHAAGPSQNLVYFKEAIAYRGVGTQEAREQLSQAAISIVGAQSVATDIKQQFVQTAADAMTAQANEASQNARFPFFLGILFDHAGLFADGKVWLEKAKSLSPRKQSILFELGLNAFARQDTAQALAYFKEAYDLAPAYGEARLYYAAAAIRNQNDALAEELLAPMITAGTAADARIASAYASRNRYDKIAEIWEAYIALHPQELDARLTLAGAFYTAGNRAQSIAVLEKAKRDIPGSAAQIDALIEQVRAGTVSVE